VARVPDDVIEDVEVVEDEVDIVEEKRSSRSTRPSSRRPPSRPAEEDDDVDELEEVDDFEEEDRPRSRRAAGKARGRREDEDFEDEDYEEDEEEERPRRRRRPRRRWAREPVDVQDAVLLGIGLVLLGLIIASQFLDFFATRGLTNVSTGLIHEWEGKVFLIVGILVLLAGTAAMVLLFTATEDVSGGFVAGTSAAGAGLGVAVLMLTLGTVIKAFVISAKASKLLSERVGTAIQVERPSVLSSLGFGFWLMFITALGLVGLFGFLGAARKQQVQMLAAGLGAGFVLGLCIWIFDIKPWTSGIPDLPGR
jgi:hypothetical protein